MVTIHDDLSNTWVFFPKNFTPSASGLTLTIKSTVNNTAFSFNVQDASGLTDFFVLNPDFSEVPDGEYKYEIKDGENTINSTGLLMKGEHIPANEQYNHTVEYTQYEYE